jgi:hypothetical protein
MKVLFFNPEQYVDFENEPSNLQCRLPILNCGAVTRSVDHIYQRDLRADGRAAMDRRALETVAAFRPDVVVYSSTWPHENLSSDVLAAIRAMGVGVLGVLWDSWIEPSTAEAELLAACDVLVVCDSLHSYLRCRATGETLSPGCKVAFAAGQVFTDLLRPDPACAKIHDVTMLGSNEGQRVELVARLAEELPKHGLSFNKAGGLVDSRRGGFGLTDAWVPWDEYVRIINRSHICLCSPTDPTRLQIKGKIFDFQACGVMCLTDDNIETRRFIPPDAVAVFTDVQDCVDQIRRHMSQPEERRRIAETGRRWLTENFDYRRFWSQALACAAGRRPDPPTSPLLEDAFARLKAARGLTLRRNLSTAQRLARLTLWTESATLSRPAVTWLRREGRLQFLALEGGVLAACNRMPLDFAMDDGRLIVSGDAFGLFEPADGLHLTADGSGCLLIARSQAMFDAELTSLRRRVADGELNGLSL